MTTRPGPDGIDSVHAPGFTRRQALVRLGSVGGLALASALMAACGGTAAAPVVPAATTAATLAPASTRAASVATAAPAISATTASATVAAAAKPVSGTVSVTFWNPLGSQLGDVINGMVKKFNESQQEVVVKADFSGDYYATQDKLLTGLAAGQVPDMTIMEIGGIVTFADNGALLSLDNLINASKDFDIKDFVEPLMLNARYKGTTYSLPFNRSTPLFYYNKEMFQATGLNADKAPANWDEVRQAADKLTKKSGSDVTVYGYAPPLDYWFYASMIWQAGGEIVSTDSKKALFNEPAGVEALTFWNDLVHKDGTTKVPPGEGFNAWNATKADFIAGKTAMLQTSTGDINFLTTNAKFPVGTGFLPLKKRYGCATGGANVVLFDKSPKDKQQAAWKFTRWLTDVPQVEFWSQNTGYLVSRTSVMSSPTMQAYYQKNPNYKTAVDQLQYVHPTPQNPGWPKVQNNLTNLYLQKAVVGGQPIKPTLDALVADADKSLNGS